MFCSIWKLLCVLFQSAACELFLNAHIFPEAFNENTLEDPFHVICARPGISWEMWSLFEHAFGDYVPHLIRLTCYPTEDCQISKPN